jgi:malonate transporter
MIDLLANSLVPIFVGLLFGYVAGLRKVVDNKNVKTLVSFLMTFALPCYLFVTMASKRQLLWDQAKPALVFAIVYTALFIATYYAWRNLSKDTAANSAVLALTLGFPNAAAVGIPLLLAVYGPRASVTVAVALAVGAITITPITLAILKSSISAGRTLSQAARIRASLWSALKNPVFWAPVLGVVMAVVKFHMPVYVEKSLAILGAATEGTALFVTGLIVSAQRFRLNWSVGLAVLAKNVIQPALCFALVSPLAMPLERTRYVVLLSAIPCGFFGILFGEGFDATQRWQARASLQLLSLVSSRSRDGLFSSTTSIRTSHVSLRSSFRSNT